MPAAGTRGGVGVRDGLCGTPRGRVVWRASRGIWATSDVLCGAGIVNRAGDIDARVAPRIAAGRYSTGVATGVACGVAALFATVVATSTPK